MGEIPVLDPLIQLFRFFFICLKLAPLHLSLHHFRSHFFVLRLVNLYLIPFFFVVFKSKQFSFSRYAPSYSFTSISTDMTNERRENYVTVTRYLTYLGLCIATCVILQSSTWAASAVGLAVALYISVSEYWLHMNPSPTSNNNGPRPFEDLFKG